MFRRGTGFILFPGVFYSFPFLSPSRISPRIPRPTPMAAHTSMEYLPKSARLTSKPFHSLSRLCSQYSPPAPEKPPKKGGSKNGMPKHPVCKIHQIFITWR